MFRVDWLPVALPTWDELARGWSRTIGHRFQSNLRSTDVVVCYVCANILDPLYSAHSFKQRLGVLRCAVDIQFAGHIEENLDSCGNRGWNYYHPHSLVHWEHLGYGRARGRTYRLVK